MIIKHNSMKFRKMGDIGKLKEILFKDYKDKNKISIHTLQLDHIIPFVISQDNSIKNLQLLKPREHTEKTVIDRKIFREFKKMGWMEKVTNYSVELKIPTNKLKEEYQKRYSQLSQD